MSPDDSTGASAPSTAQEGPTGPQFEALAQSRHALRKLLADSEQACAAAGLTTQRFQALLLIKTTSAPLSIGGLAEALYLRHHSAVELAARLEASGLVKRVVDAKDRRRVLLHLTELGASRLADLARAHLAGLAETRAAFGALFQSMNPPA